MAPKTNLHLVALAPPVATTPPVEPTEPEAEPELLPLTPDQQKFAHSALPLIDTCTRDLARRYPGRVMREELLGPGFIGADEAARKYDEKQHPDFLQYARQYIRFRMYDAIRVDHTSLRARIERDMERAFDRFTSHQTPEADSFSDPQEKVDEGAREGHHDALAAAFFAAALEAKGASQEEVHLELEGQWSTLEAISDALGRLIPKEREVMRLIYEEDLSVDDAAAKLGVAPSTLYRRHAKAIRKLRMFLVLQGVTDPRLLDR